MGCFSSKSKMTGPQNSNSPQTVCEDVDPLENIEDQEEPENLTEEQKKLLRKSWLILQNHIAKVGTVTFMRLFDSHPDVQNTFLPFRGLSNKDMESSAILRAHALRVMATVEKCITRLDRIDKTNVILKELGHRHIDYQVKPKYISLMGPQFMMAIKPHLESQWSDEMEEAWTHLFRIISYHMKKGLRPSKAEQI